MGNRAVITFAAAKSAPCIYLHWNGSRCSVEAILRAARHLNLNAPMQGDDTRFDTQAQVLDAIQAMLKPWTSSVYRETYGSSDTDNRDNGVYLIDKDLAIVGRKFHRGREDYDDVKTQAVYAELIRLNTEVAE